jgi:hypothetical protein
MPAVIVFVHIGKNPSPTLINMALEAKIRMTEVSVLLVTDHPNSWEGFPGEILKYREQDRSDFVIKFIKKFPELKTISGGYWLYTLERLFALKIVYDFIPVDTPFVHLESDVLSLFNQQDFDFIVQTTSRLACPRFSQKRGVASILFVPNEQELSRVLTIFTNVLNVPSGPTNDMDLLGVCLNENFIDELPTSPIDSAKTSEGENLVFDGAAYGQYLFGQDSFHTFGKRISGYQNPDFTLKLEQTVWVINEAEGAKPPHLNFCYEGELFRVLNLHVHSKMLLKAPTMFNPDWVRAIEEANGQIVRVADSFRPSDIHSGRVSILNRIRIARRQGLSKAILNGLLKRARSISTKHEGRPNEK